MLGTRPQAGEFEVSVFGPGVGESIVVHLGAGKWMVVDSCINPQTKRPAALEYLEAIKVDPSRDVAVIVITHWHDDHTGGISEILRACPEAALFCSVALNKREFFQLVSSASQLRLVRGSGSGVDEMARVFAVLGERRRDGARVISPEYASASLVVYRSSQPPCVVEALSPSSTSITRGMLSFAPGLRAPKRTIPNPGPNELSVALHVQLGDVVALLGADLEAGSSDQVGWRAVVANPRRPATKATIVKVPHHGSTGADHPASWSSLVGPTPYAAVTPFNSSRLPRPADLKRIQDRGARVFHASPSKPKALRFDKSTARALEGIVIRERRGALGHMRFRVMGTTVTTETFGAAAEIRASP